MTEEKKGSSLGVTLRKTRRIILCSGSETRLPDLQPRILRTTAVSRKGRTLASEGESHMLTFRLSI